MPKGKAKESKATEPQEKAEPVQEAEQPVTDTMTGEELLSANLASLTQSVVKINETLDLIVQKMENMACHIIANEAIIKELLIPNNINLASVNSTIRSIVADESYVLDNAAKIVDIAATIVSRVPQRRV